jgi:alpha-L-rhamnosidase
MKQYAALLNKDDDLKEYTYLADKVRDAINNTYLNKDSLYYANNTITANALALSFGIPPEEKRSKVFDNLSYKMTHVYKNHTSTGLVGGQWIMRTLTNNGKADIAYQLATNKTYPSWGYMTEQGATTIWELWNGNTGDPLMNSGNHVMLLGDLIIWFYEDIAGIKSDISDPGFKHIIMNPINIPGLDFAKASYHSVRGLIKSSWKKEKHKFSWDITIPANTSATVYILADNADNVMENGKPISKSLGIKFLKMEDGKAVLNVTSGAYRFTSK